MRDSGRRGKHSGPWSTDALDLSAASGRGTLRGTLKTWLHGLDAEERADLPCERIEEALAGARQAHLPLRELKSCWFRLPDAVRTDLAEVIEAHAAAVRDVQALATEVQGLYGLLIDMRKGLDEAEQTDASLLINDVLQSHGLPEAHLPALVGLQRELAKRHRAPRQARDFLASLPSGLQGALDETLPMLEDSPNALARALAGYYSLLAELEDERLLADLGDASDPEHPSIEVGRAYLSKYDNQRRPEYRVFLDGRIVHTDSIESSGERRHPEQLPAPTLFRINRALETWLAPRRSEIAVGSVPEETAEQLAAFRDAPQAFHAWAESWSEAARHWFRNDSQVRRLEGAPPDTVRRLDPEDLSRPSSTTENGSRPVRVLVKSSRALVDPRNRITKGYSAGKQEHSNDVTWLGFREGDGWVQVRPVSRLFQAHRRRVYEVEPYTEEDFLALEPHQRADLIGTLRKLLPTRAIEADRPWKKSLERFDQALQSGASLAAIEDAALGKPDAERLQRIRNVVERFDHWSTDPRFYRAEHEYTGSRRPNDTDELGGTLQRLPADAMSRNLVERSQMPTAILLGPVGRLEGDGAGFLERLGLRQNDGFIRLDKSKGPRWDGGAPIPETDLLSLLTPAQLDRVLDVLERRLPHLDLGRPAHTATSLRAEALARAEVEPETALPALLDDVARERGFQSFAEAVRHGLVGPGPGSAGRPSTPSSQTSAGPRARPHLL